ncbi:MAG: (d)CMP kinase [Actinomycetota bacterium]
MNSQRTDLVIAIDGPAGAGKSTVSRSLASTLGIERLDTGAMYRAVAAAAIHHGSDLHDVVALVGLASALTVAGDGEVLVADLAVGHLLRLETTNSAVSIVAATPQVREVLVSHQRQWVQDRNGCGVVEGRDIASVVFPDATLKVYLTASAEERAKRRADEGAASVLRRDEVDSTRAVSPLHIAPGSRVLDTTGRTIDDVTSEILSWLQ